MHEVLPEAVVTQLDTQANVIQALESHRVDAAAVDLSTVRWMVARTPDKYADAGKWWRTMLYGAALPQGDLDWLTFVDQCFTCAMFGHENELYYPAFKKYFGQDVPAHTPGLPVHLSTAGSAVTAALPLYGKKTGRCIISISGSSGGTSTSSAGACC